MKKSPIRCIEAAGSHVSIIQFLKPIKLHAEIELHDGVVQIVDEGTRGNSRLSAMLTVESAKRRIMDHRPGDDRSYSWKTAPEMH